MHSFVLTVVCLSLVSTSAARGLTPHSYREYQALEAREAEQKVWKSENRFINWFKHLFSQRAVSDPQPDTTCYEDGFYEFVPTLGEQFCQEYMNYPNQTFTIDYTPTSTFTDTYTTKMHTATSLIRVKPTTTVTVTITRSPSNTPQITARALPLQQFDQVAREYNAIYRRQEGGSMAPYDVASFRSAFSSACSCQDYAGPTVTVTYTDDPTVATLSAFDRETTTIATTKIESATTTTETTLVEPSATSSSESGTVSTSTPPSSQSSLSSNTVEPQSSSSTIISPNNPTPTAPSFRCPEDHNMTQSEMVGNAKYDYLILCDTVLMDSNVPGDAFGYTDFNMCIGACSVADSYFNSPICQGVSFYSQNASEYGNCFLKTTRNFTVPAPGVDSAILKRVEFGVTNSSTAGTTTESAPFGGETATQNSAQVSSSVASMFSNSSSYMPMITPVPHLVQSGIMVQPFYTQYSTYISGGSTFSTGTGYTTATTFPDGTWFSYYYTSFSEAWAYSTAIYEIVGGGQQIANSTNSQSSSTANTSGGYNTTTVTNTTSYGGGWRNISEVISNQGYDSNGTEVYSSDTTYHFDSATGAVVTERPISTNAGAPANNTAFVSESVFSTMIISSRGIGDASSEFASGGATPTPYTSAITIVNTFGTTYSTLVVSSGFVPSGAASGQGSGIASGGPSSTPTSPLTVIVSSGGSSGGSSGFGLGGIGSSGATPTPSLVSVIVNSSGASGASNGFGSGGPSSTPSAAIPTTVILKSTAKSGVSSGFASDGSSPTGSPPSTVVSYIVSSSGTGYFATGVTSGGPTGTGSSPTSSMSVIVSSGGTQGASSGIISGWPSSSSSSGSFTNSNIPRSGSISSSSTLPGSGIGTASSSYTGIVQGTGTSSPSRTAPGTAPPSSTGTTPSTAPILSSTGAYVVPGSSKGSFPGTASSSPIGIGPETPPISSPSGTAPGTAPTTPAGTAPSTSLSCTAPFSSWSGSVSAPGEPRSPYPSTSSGTAPLSGLSPSSSPSVSIRFSTNTSGGYSGFLPPPSTSARTSSSLGAFTNTGGNRSPYSSVPSGTVPLNTAPTAPHSTGPPSTRPTVPLSTVTLSAGTTPLNTAPMSSSAASGSLPSRPIPYSWSSLSAPSGTGPPPSQSPNVPFNVSPPSSGTAPLNTAPGTPSSGFPASSGSFSAPGAPRSPYPSGTAPLNTGPTSPPLSTGPFSFIPPVSITAYPYTCMDATIGTTTIFSTVTILGCDSTCNSWGGYGTGPQAFGAPLASPNIP